MKNLVIFLSLAVAVVFSGCASDAPKPDTSQETGQAVKFHVSDRALALIEEQGKASAAMNGYDRDSDLVCEWLTKTGSHITVPVCYTRAEMEEYRDKMRMAVQKTLQGGPCLPVGGPTAGPSAGIGGGNQPIGGCAAVTGEMER